MKQKTVKLTTATPRPDDLVLRRRLLAVAVHGGALAAAAGCFGRADAAVAGAVAAGCWFGGCHFAGGVVGGLVGR